MIPAIVALHLLVLVRAATFVGLLPPFLGRGLPAVIKIGVAVALTLVWAGVAPMAGWPATFSLSHLLFLAAREFVTGAALACCFDLVLLPSRMVGAALNEELGLGFAETISPVDSHNQNVMTQIMESLGAALFFTMRLDLVMYHLLDASFRRHPAGTTAWLPRPEWLIALLEHTEKAGLSGAAPVLCVSMLTTVSLLVFTRWIPQLHLFSIGFQVRTIVGLATVVVFLPEICESLVISMRDLVDIVTPR